MKQDILENLQSQLDELEMLQSMFPDPKVELFSSEIDSRITNVCSSICPLDCVRIRNFNIPPES